MSIISSVVGRFMLVALTLFGIALGVLLFVNITGFSVKELSTYLTYVGSSAFIVGLVVSPISLFTRFDSFLRGETLSNKISIIFFKIAIFLTVIGYSIKGVLWFGYR